jgi:GNAT superfamily N-acetyltransferase
MPRSSSTVRSLAPSDREALAVAFERLSPESRHRRFLGPKPTLSERELTWLTEIDHVSHEAIAAFDASGAIIGVARYNAWPNRTGAADLAVVVLDEYQRRRIGTRLAIHALWHAKANGFAVVTGTTLFENRAARALLRKLSFAVTGNDGALLEAELQLA